MSITRCPHCGTANRAGSNFCNGCGTDLRNPDARPEEGPEAPETPQAAAPEPPAAPSKPPRARAKRARTARPAAPPPEPPSAEPPFADQPWLRLEFDAGGTAEETSAAKAVEGGAEGETRLVSGVQGLLAPIRVATNIGDDDPAAPAVTPLPPPSRHCCPPPT
ncbi:MAG: hypothetical protein DCC57_15885 [Chloroflexi bacterium]|nr:MAG: hypothetical protein DCC57_15885 [Chloroflexota bacterium]